MSLTNPDHSLDGESKAEIIQGLAVAFTVVTIAVVSARMYTRAVMLRQVGIDDYMIVATSVLAIGMNIATFLEGYYGVGRHSWVATPDHAIRQLQCLFSAIQLYIWALCLVKVSLLLQYRRIFTAVWLQRLSLFLIGFAICWNIAQSILVTFACIPMSILIPSLAQNCLEPLTIWYIAAGFNIATDFIVCLMPIPLINSLQLPFKQKFLLCAVFGLGLIACSISIGRVPTLYLVVNADDPSWFGSDAAILSMTEVNTAILCSCLPPIRFLLARVFPFLGTRMDPTSASHKYPSAKPNTTTSHRSRMSRRVSNFIMHSKKSAKQFDEEIDLGAVSGGSGSHSNTLHSATGDTPPSKTDVVVEAGKPSPRGCWFNFDDDDKSPADVHSNYISAWVSANTDGHGARRVSEDASSERRLVDQVDLGQQIIITRETVVQTEEGHGTAKSSPVRLGRAL